MKKTIVTLFTLLTLGAMRSHAQAIAPRWSLALEGGPAFPVGAFANTHSTATAGNARTGVGAELSATYRFCPSWGVTVLGGPGLNPEHNDVTPVITPGGAYYVHNEYKEWKMIRFLAGPTFEQPLTANGRLSLQVRALAGILKTRLPDVTQYETTDLTKSDAETLIYSKLPWAFAYQADVGLKWKIERHLALIFDAGYMDSKHTANVSWASAGRQGSGPVINPQTSMTVEIGVIQCRAGVEFSF